MQQPTNTTTLSWANIQVSEPLQRAIISLNYPTPSSIQLKAIPLFSDVLVNPTTSLRVQAPHGCGKTASFIIGVLNNLPAAQNNKPSVLVVVPTRELAIQIEAVFNSFCASTGHKVSVVGSEPNCDIYISTPGYVLSLLNHPARPFSNIDWVIVDEADLMLVESSFRTQLLKISKAIQQSANMSSRIAKFIFYSATYPELITRFLDVVIKGYSTVFISTEDKPILYNENNIRKEFVIYHDKEDEKYNTLKELYALMSISQAIVFCDTIAQAKLLVNRLIKDDYKVGIIYGKGMEREERDKIMKDFRDGNTSILVTTNLLARGIDVIQVNFVVNYSLPMKDRQLDEFTYKHRVGRGGRFGRKSVSVNLLENNDENRYNISLLEKSNNEEIEEIQKKDVFEFSEKIKEFFV